MSQLLKNPSALAAATLGFLAMAILGWKMADQQPPASIPQPEQTAKVANRPSRHVRKSGPPEAVRQQMAAIRALGTPEERMRATIELAYNLPVSEIEAWMEGRWFNTGQGFDLSLFNKILKERWNKEDPEGMLVWSIKNHSGDTSETLASWAATDPARVTAFFKNHPNKDLQLQSLAAIAKSNPAYAIQCLRETTSGSVSEDGSSSYYTREVLAELAKSSPAELQAALASLPTGLKTQAEIVLIGQRLQTSFADEFQKLLERPDGLKILSANLSNNRGLGDKVFDQLADLPAAWKSDLALNSYDLMDASTAAKWWDADLKSLGFSDKDAKRIRTTALNRISRKQPEEALKLLGSSDFDARTRSTVISNIFRNLEGTPEKGEALVALLGSEEEKQEARASLAANSDVGSAQKIEKPADWLEKISTLYLNAGSTYQYLSMLREWDPDKIADLGNQFRSLPDDRKKQAALAIANIGGSSGIDRTLVGDAIRYVATQPAATRGENQGRSSDPIAQASEFAVNWSKTDPAAAGTWVQSLPAGDARLWAQKNLAANWAQYDPAEAAQWVKTLPAAERAKVQEFMESGRK